MSQEQSPESIERGEVFPLLIEANADNNRSYGGVSGLNYKSFGHVEESVVSDAGVSTADTVQSEGAEFAASRHLIVLVLTFGIFIAQLETSFVMATHGIIASQFEQLENSSWLLVSYTLAVAAVQPLYGKLSDIYGRKNLLMVCYSFFAAGCAICGLAPSMSVEILGRVVSGIGGAGLQTLVSLIILDLFPLREVASLRSYVNIAATTGRSLGGPIGGFLSDTVGWRWSFLGQCPLIAIAALLAFCVIPSKENTKDENPRDKLRRIDFAGAFTLAVTISSFLLALEIGGQKYPWSSPPVWSLFVAGFVSASLFVTIEKYWAVEPIFPLEMFRHKDVIFSYFVFALQIAAQLTLMFCVPLYFQITQNASTKVAGAHLMPAVIGNAFGALLAGIIIKRTGRYKILLVVATIVAAICYTTLILRWTGKTNFWESLEIIPGGFGAGMSEAAIFISISASVEPSKQSIALSGLFLSASVGIIGGLAISSSVLQISFRNELERRLAGVSHSEKIIRNSLKDIHYVLGLKGKLHDIVTGAYIRGLEYTHGVSLISVALAFAFSLFLSQKRV